MKRRRLDDDDEAKKADVSIGSYSTGFELDEPGPPPEPLPERRPIGFIHFPDPPDPCA